MSEAEYESVKAEFNQLQIEPREAPKPPSDAFASGEDNDGECEDQ